MIIGRFFIVRWFDKSYDVDSCFTPFQLQSSNVVYMKVGQGMGGCGDCGSVSNLPMLCLLQFVFITTIGVNTFQIIPLLYW